MNPKMVGEILLNIVLIVLLVGALNPFGGWMPTPLVMALMVVLALLLALFIGSVWRERARDEREEAHRALAGRAAYLVGIALLGIGVLAQMYTHHMDPWLLVALVGMVLSKSIVRFSLDTQR